MQSRPATHKRIRVSFAILALMAICALVASIVPAPPFASERPQAFAAELVAAQGAADVAAGDAGQAAPSIPAVAGGSVTVRAKVEGAGWKAAVAAGKTAGTKSKKALQALKVSLVGLDGVRGSVNYRVYARAKGWKKIAKNGASTGSYKNVEAVKIWLDGEVAANYDVLYRVYLKGKGWQPWVKNKAKAGIVKKGYRVNAVQVKLSPKTEDALGKSADTVGVRYEGRMKSTGWLAWTGDGGTAGTAKKSKQLEGLAVKADAGALSGGITYRAYVQGKKWKLGWKSNGTAAGKAGKRIEGIQIKLTGALAERYDVYYRTYMQKYGWLDWAKNGASAGGPGNKLRVAAVQVVVVPKGDDNAPGSTLAPTVNSRKQALNGVDISSWQSGLNPAKLTTTDFIIVKATESTNYVNPYFKKWADATLASGKLLGAYHFAQKGDAEKQADYFAAAVGPYVGKCVLFLDWEAGAVAQGPAWAKKFMDRVYKKTGVRPLIYMSKSVTHEWDWSSVAKSYKLWVAQYANYKRTDYQSDPWTDSNGYGAWELPTLFQYSSTGKIAGYSGNIDLDKFYGTASTWKKLAAKS